jgi:hypothetical protein
MVPQRRRSIDDASRFAAVVIHEAVEAATVLACLELAAQVRLR